MKKKWIAGLLSLVMLLSLAATGAAAAEQVPEEDPMAVVEETRQQEVEVSEEEPVAAALEGETFYSPYTETNYTVAKQVKALGIDVSRWQGNIDWEAVAADGIEFAIIRVGYRGYGSGTLAVDNYFETNMKGALAAGIKVGVYIFTEAVTPEEAAEEADFVVSLVKDYQMELPIFYDLEFTQDDYRLDAAYNALETAAEKQVFLESLCNAFCTRVRELGYTPLVYSNTYMLTNLMAAENLNADLWLAQYNTRVTYKGTGDYKFWQYSSKGQVDGIDGNVDLSFCFDRSYLSCMSHLEDDTEDLGESTLTITPTAYPVGNISAKAFDLKGSITSNYKITHVSAVIFRADGAAVQTVVENPYSTTFQIERSKVDNGMKFARLSSGYYYLKYSVVDQSGKQVEWTSDVFAVLDTQLFADVLSSSAWYYSKVYSAASQGIIKGIPTDNGQLVFEPNGQLTRIQAVQILYQQAGYPQVTGTHPFADTTAQWCQAALIWAYQNGIVVGTSDVTFSPNESVTREQFATFLYRAKGQQQEESEPIADYLDADDVSPWASDALNWCIAQGVITSTSPDGLVAAPQADCTRAQAVTMLLNLS